MPTNMSAKGYTNVILVLNMKRFIRLDDQARFETIRGTAEFAETLRTIWPGRAAEQDVFVPVEEYEKSHVENGTALDGWMSTEQVGFATGVFRSLMLEKFTFPTYVLDKTKVNFEQGLTTNFQFKTLFQRAWERWSIYIRPSHTGFFTIRLSQEYTLRPRSFQILAKDVLRLQESLDVPSAQRWLQRNREKYKNEPETLAVKERSVKALLDWIGTTEEESGELVYYPVQWKLAMEVAERFMSEIAQIIELSNANPIEIIKPAPSLSVPLHDSYVIYHFDEIYSDPSSVKRAQKSTASNAQIQISMNDIRQSPRLRRNIMNLMEGTLLRTPDTTRDKDATQPENDSFFPEPRWSISDSIDEQNQSSWNDELCLLSGRTALIMPSLRWREHEMAISTVPSATLQVHYIQYWEAIERMIEFILEIRVLAQLIESNSYDVLGDIIPQVHATRSKLFLGDIEMEQGLPELITRAAHLRRLAALAQGISHPQLWSRAEYAIRKAEYLFKQLGVDVTLENIERNIDSINSVVDHVDELYIADLSEKSNDKATLMSIGLAAASLTLTLLILPSFWTDLEVTKSLHGLYLAILIVGTALGIILIIVASYLIWKAWKNKNMVIDMFDKIFNHDE